MASPAVRLCRIGGGALSVLPQQPTLSEAYAADEDLEDVCYDADPDAYDLLQIAVTDETARTAAEVAACAELPIAFAPSSLSAAEKVLLHYQGICAIVAQPDDEMARLCAFYGAPLLVI